MNELEQRLRLALVAHIGGARRPVTCGQVVEALQAHGVPAGAAAVHSFALEDFLVIFSKTEQRNMVAVLPSLSHGGFSLFFKPWTRQAQATQVCMRKKVHLALEGIPTHAWEPKVIEDLLGKAYVVEEVAPETKTHSDLSLVKLTAWTSDLASIPVAKTLVIPEPSQRETRVAPAPASRISEVKALQYKVLIHLTSVEEDVVSKMGASSSQGRGANGSSEPDSGNGGGGDGVRRITRAAPWRRGQPDLRDGPGAGAHTKSRQGHAQVEDLGWSLPAMRGHAPYVVWLELSGSNLAAHSGKDASPNKVSRSVQPEPVEGSQLGGLRQTEEVPLAGTNVDAVSESNHRRELVETDPKADGCSRPATGISWEDAEESLPVGGGETETAVLQLLDEKVVLSESDQLTEPVTPSSPCEGSSRVGQWPGTSATEEYFLVSLSSGASLESEQREQASDPQTVEEVERQEDSGQCMQGAAPTANPKENSEAYRKIKHFCANILKTLAPPLLKEIESSSSLRATAEPFTPRRFTRSSASVAGLGASTHGKSATAAETVLLKALGITPGELAVAEKDLEVFRRIFDSPLRENHLRAVASIFGKMVPTSFEPMETCQLAVSVQ
jgi:hypothetical protein